MTRTKKQANTPVVEEQTDLGHEPQALSATREDYLRARAVIQLYRENQKSRPKRKCSEKQLEALRAGREKRKNKQTNND